MGGPYKVLGELLFFTACRIGEARIATWGQFDLEATPPVWYITGKGARKRGPKTRQMPLHPDLAATLTEWRAANPGTEYVFASKQSATGHRNASSFTRWAEQICEEAGVGHVTAHRWRHTVATIALEETRDIRAVQELLGHASLQSTQVYTQVAPGRFASIVSALGGSQ